MFETSPVRIWFVEEWANVGFDEGLGWVPTADSVMLLDVESFGSFVAATFEAMLADSADYFGFFEGALRVMLESGLRLGCW